MCVRPRVGEHLFGKRPDAPISELVALVGCEITIHLEEISQAVTGESYQEV